MGDGLRKAVHALREEVVAIERGEGVGLGDGRCLLQQYGAGVDAPVDPEDGDAGLRIAVDDGPVDGAAPAVERQQRRVVLNRAVLSEGPGRAQG